MRCFTRNHGIKSRRTGQFPKGHVPFNTGTKGIMKANSGTFKKGNEPVNRRPIGSERINVEGYIEIKVAEPSQWALKHRIVYEQAHGEIPPRHNIRFRDGDRQNLSLDNMVLVSDQRERAIECQVQNEQPAA
ncbi:HNH endonuclease signature motif containing protein [Enterovibrio sp. Hal110]